MPGQIKVEMTSADAKLAASLAAQTDRVKVLEKALKQAGQVGRAAGDEIAGGMKRAGAQHRRSFGRGAQSDLAAFAKSMLGVSAAVGLVVKGLREANTERQRGAELTKLAADPQAQLAQLAGGDTGKLRALLAEVRATRLQTGAGAEEAAGLQFALESLGLGKERKFFAQFRGIADPRALAEGAATIGAAFGPAAGSTRAIANKLLAASSVSKTTVEQFAPAATISAKSIQAIGGTDVEGLAAIAELSKPLKSAEVASTQIRALVKVIEEKGLAGKGLLAALPELERQTAGLTGEEFTQFFGREEAKSGFRNLRDLLAQIRQTERLVSAAGAATGPGDLSARMQRDVMKIPGIAAARQAAIAAQQRELAEETVGPGQLRTGAVIDRAVAQSIRDRESGFTRLARRVGGGIVQFLGGSEESVMTGASFGGGLVGGGFGAVNTPESPHVAQNLAEGLQRFGVAVDKFGQWIQMVPQRHPSLLRIDEPPGPG